MSLKNKKLATAALAGLFASTVLVAGASFAASEKASCTGKDKTAKTEKANCKTADGKDKNACKGKHACKGKNACKGQGADGKNACKGKGSCKTDDSKE